MALDLLSIDSQQALQNVLVDDDGKETTYFDSKLGKLHLYLLYWLMRQRGQNI